MIQAFYSASLGAQQQMKRMDVQGNNIANVNTQGFKREAAAFEAALYTAENGVDGNLLPKGSGSRILTTTTDFSAGSLEQTGRSQDYAIIGEGYFALYNPATGETSYTRDGSFTVAPYGTDQDGNTVFYLSDGEGRQVLDGNGDPIPATVSDEAFPVGVYTVQYEDGMQHLDGNRFLTTAKNGAVTAIEGQVQQGYLESSNTDLATELGKVIEAQRSYSYALKMMTTADEVETTVNNLAN